MTVAPKFFNSIRMTTATTGTGTVTLGSAVRPDFSFVEAGVPDATVVTYRLLDGSNSEIGRGTYSSGAGTLTRDLVLQSTNSNNKISLSGTAVVIVTIAREDISLLGAFVLDKDRFAPPLPTDFPTIVNTNSTNPNVSYALTQGLIIGSADNMAGGDNCRGVFKSLPAGNWTITTKVKINHRASQYATCGLCLRESGTGKLIQFGMDTKSLDIVRWTNPTTYSATSFDTGNGVWPPMDVEWYRIVYDGTNLNYWISMDGAVWVRLYYEAATAFMAGGPNQVGFLTHVSIVGTWNLPPAGGDLVAMTVLYYEDDGFSASARAVSVGFAPSTALNPLSPPAVADLSWLNQGSCTATQGTNGLQLYDPGHGNSVSNVALYKATSGLTFCWQFKLSALIRNTNFNGYGIFMQESGSGKWIALEQQVNTYTSQSTDHFILRADHGTTDFTGRSGSPTSDTGYGVSQQIKWFRMRGDGTYIYGEVSNDDGQNWQTIFTWTAASVFTTAPDRVGLFTDTMNEDTTAKPMTLICSDMRQGSNLPNQLPILTQTQWGTRRRDIGFYPPTKTLFADTSVYGRTSSATALVTVDDPISGMTFVDPTADTTGFKTVLRPIPSALQSSFQFAARIRRLGFTANMHCGICIANNSGAVAALCVMNGSPDVFYDPSWASSTWADNDFTLASKEIEWLKIGFDSAGALHYYGSRDGVQWFEVYVGARTLSGTGVTSPTKYGFFIGRYSGSGAPSMSVPYFFSDEFPAPSLAPLI